MSIIRTPRETEIEAFFMSSGKSLLSFPSQSPQDITLTLKIPYSVVILPISSVITTESCAY